MRLCVHTHTKGEEGQRRIWWVCAKEVPKMGIIFFPFHLTASRRARKAPSSRVLCRSALCLYTHLMTPLTPRLEVKQSGYYIPWSTCEYPPQRESLHRKKRLRRKRQWKSGVKNIRKIKKKREIFWRCAICWRYKRWHPAVWTSPSRTWWVGI